MIGFFDRFDVLDPINLNDPEGILQSIRDELSRILSTTSSFPWDEYEELLNNPLNYGIPGLYGIPSLHFTNPYENLGRFLMLCEKAIIAYEPRISKASITAIKEESTQLELDITLALHPRLHTIIGESFHLPYIIRM
jgi:predicted component of type VI protein secretion system